MEERKKELKEEKEEAEKSVERFWWGLLLKIREVGKNLMQLVLVWNDERQALC